MSKLFAVGLLVIIAFTTLAQSYPNNAVKNSRELLDRHMMLNSASAQDNAQGMPECSYDYVGVQYLVPH